MPTPDKADLVEQMLSEERLRRAQKKDAGATPSAEGAPASAPPSSSGISLSGKATGSATAFDFVAHLTRQAEFSQRTFGPGIRTAGVVDHIRKELREIEAKPHDLSEWIDVVILGLDGAWRAGYTPEDIVARIVLKQAANELRAWPDWRTAAPDKAIEHVRTGEVATGSATDLDDQDSLHTGDDALLDALTGLRAGLDALLEGEHGTMSAEQHEALGDIYEALNQADELRIAELTTAPSEIARLSSQLHEAQQENGRLRASVDQQMKGCE